MWTSADASNGRLSPLSPLTFDVEVWPTVRQQTSYNRRREAMTLRSWLKKGIEAALRPYGYRLIKPSSQFGIDAIADVLRLSKLWNIDVALVFDIGANIGTSSRLFRSAWPACEVVAFEPNEDVARQLRANVESVGLVNIEQIALSSRSGRSDFFIYEDASVLGSLKESTPFTERLGLRNKAVSVSVMTLDDFCRERAIQQINLLKIDAEGSDHDILLGGKSMLEGKSIDFIYCEFNSLGSAPGQFGSLLPIATLLSEHGYNFIASYNDYILTDGAFFSTSNALFAADRGGS